MSRPTVAMALLAWGLGSAGCGDDSGGKADARVADASADGAPDGGTAFSVLDPFLPPLPPAGTGTRKVFAEVITAANRNQDTIGGLAAQGGLGDLALRNDKIRLVIQKPGRSLGVISGGGNIIDADLVRSSGPDNDQFGELDAWFNVGRYPYFDTCQVLADGSDGGAGVIRCFGHADELEFINVPGMLWEFSTGLQTALKNLKLDQPADFVTAVTYILKPGDAFAEVNWTFYNPAATDYKGEIGSVIDTGAVIEPFSPYWGFGPVGITDTLKLTGGPDPVDHWGFQAPGVAYGLAPIEIRDVDMDTQFKLPIQKNAVFTVSGVNLSAFAESLGVTGLASRRMHLPPAGGANVKLLFAVASDVGGTAGVLARARGRQVGHVSGTVKDSAGQPVAGARVAFSVMKLDDMNVLVSKVFTVFTSDLDGHYDGDLEPNSYTVQADVLGFPRTAEQQLVMAAGQSATLDLATGLPGQIAVNVTDATPGVAGPLACKVSVVGDATNEDDTRFRDTRFDAKPPGIVYVEALPACSKSIFLRPGGYRVFVSHGNEYTAVDTMVTVTGGASTPVGGTIKRVVDTTDWVAADFHQHGIYSHDSPMPSETKVISYVSEGIEYFVSSEHDVVHDYQADIVNAGMAGKIGFAPGVETSPADYGHWNFIDMRPDDTLTGGSIDWGTPDPLRNLTPQEILDYAKDVKGVEVRISSHPRADGYNSVFNYFDRMGLSYNLVAKTFGGDPTKMPVPNQYLHLPDGNLFTRSFEAMEIMNSHKVLCLAPQGSDVCMPGARIFDYVTDEVLKDYMNFLSYGFLVTIVGDSDSHKLIQEQNGFPRTYVLVGPGKDTPASATLTADVKHGLLPDPASGRLAGATVATNGPFVSVTVTGQSAGAPQSGGIGQLVRVDGDATVQIRVQAPDWLQYDRIEVFSNETFRDDQFVSPMNRASFDRSEPPLVSPIVFDHDPACAGTCAAGKFRIVSAGGLQTTSLTVPLAIASPRHDAWVFVRVTGSQPLYPIIPTFARWFSPSADVVATPPDFGVVALAVTGASFIDADGVPGFQGMLQ